MSDDLFCVKMRASAHGEHVSGAERIVRQKDVPGALSALAERALAHSRGRPDFINLKVEEPGEIVRLKAIKVFQNPTATAEEGRACAVELLAGAGVGRAAEIMEMLPATYAMRGAMILDVDTLERLEPDRERGVRATRMDSADSRVFSAKGPKDHFSEAIVLATKVANAPGIVGEICVSDDPGYVTGYVASKEFGYQRISVVKESGDPHGGRIFLYRGPREKVAETIRYLESQTVLVEGVPRRCCGNGSGRHDIVDAELREIAAAGLYRKCRELASEAHGAVVLASNDYLGLAGDARVAEAAAEASRRWGSGSGGSRLTTGTMPPHVALERHLAAFKGTEEAVLYATGYMANVGVLSALAKKGDVIFSDELNHASIIDGCRLSGADVVIYRHGDMDELEGKMAAFSDRRRRIAVSDGVFSMDGDVLDLPRFVGICERHDAFSIVDEAHATGVVGATGRGLAEHFGCAKPDITIGTLSKALGSEGGFACVSHALAEYLRNKSRPFVFSTAPSPGTAAAGDAALTILENEPWRVARLAENVAFFVGELAKRGIKVATGSAIVPIPVGDERRASAAAASLEKKGFVVSGIRYPTVPMGAARLRAAVSSVHGKDQLAAAAAAIAETLAGWTN